MSRTVGDYVLVASAVAILGGGIGLISILGKSKKENENQERILSNMIAENQERIFSNMRALADSSQLHPDYGNNNHLFDSAERLGVARNLGITLDMNTKISYEDALRYVQMYSK